MDTLKHKIRTQVLQKRDGLSFDVRKKKSDAICAQLEKAIKASVTEMKKKNCSTKADGRQHFGVTPFQPTIAVFSAMKSEVDLSAFIEAAFNQSWRLCFPAMITHTPTPTDTRKNTMEFFEVSEKYLKAGTVDFVNHPLRANTLESLRAEGFPFIEPTALDCMVTPLVAYDTHNNRLGYGGGNYDRYLPLLRDDAIVIGVAFKEQRVQTIPCDQHDRPLPHIITA